MSAAGRQANKGIVKRFLDEVCDQRNLALADELVSNSYVDHYPAPGEAEGRDGLKSYLAYLHRAFSDITVVIEDQVAEGDKVVTRFTANCIHRGEFAGIPPTGKRAGIAAIAIHRIEHGQIRECWLNWTRVDRFSRLHQANIHLPSQSTMMGEATAATSQARCLCGGELK